MNPDGGPSGSRAAMVGGFPSMDGGGLGLGEALALESQLLTSEQLSLDQCQEAMLAAWGAVDRRAAAEIVGVKDGEEFPSLATAAGFRGKKRVAAGAARGSGSRGAKGREHVVGVGAASAAGGAPAAGAGGSHALDLRAVGAPVLAAFGASSAAGAVGPESGVVAEHADEDEVDMVDSGATDLADAGGADLADVGAAALASGMAGPSGAPSFAGFRLEEAPRATCKGCRTSVALGTAFAAHLAARPLCKAAFDSKTARQLSGVRLRYSCLRCCSPKLYVEPLRHPCTAAALAAGRAASQPTTQAARAAAAVLPDSADGSLAGQAAWWVWAEGMLDGTQGLDFLTTPALFRAVTSVSRAQMPLFVACLELVARRLEAMSAAGNVRGCEAAWWALLALPRMLLRRAGGSGFAFTKHVGGPTAVRCSRFINGGGQELWEEALLSEEASAAAAAGHATRRGAAAARHRGAVPLQNVLRACRLVEVGQFGNAMARAADPSVAAPGTAETVRKLEELHPTRGALSADDATLFSRLSMSITQSYGAAVAGVQTSPLALALAAAREAARRAAAARDASRKAKAGLATFQGSAAERAGRALPPGAAEVKAAALARVHAAQQAEGTAAAAELAAEAAAVAETARSGRFSFSEPRQLQLDLDKEHVRQALLSAPRGAAPGGSGMVTDILKNRNGSPRMI